VPTIIRDLPYFEEHTSLTVRGRSITIHSYQIVLWVSVTPRGLRTLDPNTPRFPVVFDPGFTHNFLIREEQLQQWAGLRPDNLAEVRHIHPYGERVPTRAGQSLPEELTWLRHRAGLRPFRISRGVCMDCRQLYGLLAVTVQSYRPSAVGKRGWGASNPRSHE
jgi:hypothetical protein